jgi:hypothetical protein
MNGGARKVVKGSLVVNATTIGKRNAQRKNSIWIWSNTKRDFVISAEESPIYKN